MIFDSFLRGNSSKHVWFSVSSDLYLEAQRDLSAIGCHCKVINGLQTIDEKVKNKNWRVSNLPLSVKEGVMFCTYSTLVSGLNRQRGLRKESRLEQLVQWCGADFDGLLIFDECHRYVSSAIATARVSELSYGQLLIHRDRVCLCVRSACVFSQE
jgi:hypothetical protein